MFGYFTYKPNNICLYSTLRYCDEKIKVIERVNYQMLYANSERPWS